ncbi:MAG: chemotaxis protein CheW [Verrucomicrobiota bacterium]
MTEPYILFELAGALYGLRSRDVQHIEMLEHITPVPNTAAAVEGVVFSRGNVIPALNLRVRFGLPREPHTARTRVIFIRLHQRVVALIVDAAREFNMIATDTIKPVQETLHGIQGNYVHGVVTVKDRLVLLLDLSAVLANDNIPTPDAALVAAAH